MDDFATAVVSAFSEAFNNVAIHGYGTSPGSPPEDAPRADLRRIDIEISADDEELVIVMRDWGKSYDPRTHAELPEELPERGMGVFIIRSFADHTGYEAGSPNVLTLKKKWSPP